MAVACANNTYIAVPTSVCMYLPVKTSVGVVVVCKQIAVNMCKRYPPRARKTPSDTQQQMHMRN